MNLTTFTDYLPCSKHILFTLCRFRTILQIKVSLNNRKGYANTYRKSLYLPLNFTVNLKLL